MSAEWIILHHLPPLLHDQLQLWRIELGEANTSLLSACRQILTPAEKETAARRRAGQVREQFAVGRACLRILLGNVLALDPQAVPIVAGVHGKPCTPENPVFYNVAHSKDTILIAIRRVGAVGIDIEHIDPSPDPLEIATRWFTPLEIATLTELTDSQSRSHLFFRYWTRKEAVAKADGRGLLVALDAFDVSGVDSAKPDPFSVWMPCAEGKDLYLVRDLDLGSEFAGALALESTDSPVSLYNFPLELAL